MARHFSHTSQLNRLIRGPPGVGHSGRTIQCGEEGQARDPVGLTHARIGLIPADAMSPETVVAIPSAVVICRSLSAVSLSVLQWR